MRELDLGTGTGLLAGVLRAAGHEVIAVEPDEQMRAVAAERHPGTRVLAGSAEDIPLPDESVDAAVVGQAYHRFTPQDALPQIHRVLRKDGAFTAMWNIRDDRTPWVAALSGKVGNEGYGLERAWQYGPVTPDLRLPDAAGLIPCVRRSPWRDSSRPDALCRPHRHHRGRPSSQRSRFTTPSMQSGRGSHYGSDMRARSPAHSIDVRPRSARREPGPHRRPQNRTSDSRLNGQNFPATHTRIRL
ncbi:class I SAM-dependent methyltransferase [Kitasatospora paracochleata]|uniref:SAM-dependent methyltransferase n=1 Tax=Kitasatospora paracochleata TaxID=58354 RepID=A0ABT1J0V7_9ACTN|nr:class I SAM-dependent methyltransferase [Kitasatospora paracochleata]MCP2311032.1 SAM-dependent methyltransferase [Kitasatospora paracochleata]